MVDDSVQKHTKELGDATPGQSGYYYRKRSRSG